LAALFRGNGYFDPFDFNLVEMEKIDPKVRDYIFDVGLEL